MFKKFLIAGSLVWLPIIATIWIISVLVHIFDAIINVLPTKYHPDTLLGFHIPGLGVLIAAIVVLVTGVLVTNILGDRIMTWMDSFFKRVPFIGPLYSTIKQVTSTIISSEGKSFRKVLLIEYPRQGLWSLAFQTGETEELLNQAVGEPMLSAFIPTTPNPTSGFLILVPKNQAIEVNMTVEQAFKVIVSLGTLTAAQASALKHE